MLDDLKKILGINNNEFDSIINSYIASAKKDLEESGVDSTKSADITLPLIKTAIQTYVQAFFDINNRDAYMEAYNIQKDQLRKNSSYNGG